jgi:DNA-binding XRE family transcriptional regulator
MLRKDCCMTQVEFAAALGVAPASVHRWEAGTSNPEFELAVSLWSLAIEHGSATSARFADFLVSRATAIRPLFQATQTSSTEALQSEIASLPAEKQHQLAFAFVRMLKHNTDETADQVMRLLLERWKQKVGEEKVLAPARRGSLKQTGRKAISAGCWIPNDSGAEDRKGTEIL